MKNKKGTEEALSYLKLKHFQYNMLLIWIQSKIHVVLLPMIDRINNFGYVESRTFISILFF